MKDLSMHIMDILQNSTRAKANNITLEVLENHDADTLTLIFKDDGCGMSAETVEKVTNPFFTTRTTRKVGLGLPLLKQISSGLAIVICTVAAAALCAVIFPVKEEGGQ